jgi:hypothetical protein
VRPDLFISSRRLLFLRFSGDCVRYFLLVSFILSVLIFPLYSPSPDLDYDSRRMSSSATSAAETDASAISRGEKRPASPSLDSPQAKKSRSDQNSNNNNWDVDSQPVQSVISDQPSDSKLQLPSILTSFNDSLRPDIRRASLPNLTDRSASRIRHTPYPPTGIRVNYTPNHQSSLTSYQFPPSSHESILESAGDKASARSRLTTDSNFNLAGSFGEQSPYSSIPPLTNGTTPSTSTFSPTTFNSPVSPEYNSRHQNLSLFPDNSSWNTSLASGIVRPNSTGQLASSTTHKYEDSLRHSSFSSPISQPHLFAGSARISGQHDRKALSNAGIKNEWSFPNHDFLLPSGPTYSPPSIPSSVTPTTHSPTRAPQTVSSSTAMERPQRKRGKLPKDTTDFLKAWLHKHSDHPYPSEEEKKQLCHATGLSMSQVSNWMINVSLFFSLFFIEA